MHVPVQQEDDVRLSLRLPLVVHEAMRRLALEHDRSLNGEIIAALRTYARQEGRKLAATAHADPRQPRES